MNCGMCGKEFTPRVHNTKYCTIRCKRNAENERRSPKKTLLSEGKQLTAPVGPRILTLDIEVAPAVAHIWSMFDLKVGLNQLQSAPYMLCFAAKWYGEKNIIYSSVFHDGKLEMVQAVRELLDEADILIHFNGAQYDVPHLKREILLAGLEPPSPFKQVDLYRVARSQFRWISNKLQHVSDQLGLGQKADTGGHELWTMCMNDDPAAWAKMRRYNKQDVILTEKVYQRLLPWIPNHPHVGLWINVEDVVCPRCGSAEYQRRGYACSATYRYPRLQCKKCSGWFRGALMESKVGDSRV